MKEYPVGSVCIVIPPAYPEYVGRECTIVEGLAMRLSKDREGVVLEVPKYVVEVQGEQEQLNASHESLKLKRFPPEVDAWCEGKMKDLFNPKVANILEEELV